MTSVIDTFLSLPEEIHNLLIAPQLDVGTLQLIHISSKRLSSTSLYGLRAARSLWPLPLSVASKKYFAFLASWLKKGGTFTNLEFFSNNSILPDIQEELMRAVSSSSRIETLILHDTVLTGNTPLISLMKHVRKSVKHLQIPSIYLLEQLKDETFPLLESLSVVSLVSSTQDPNILILPNIPRLRHLEVPRTPLGSSCVFRPRFFSSNFQCRQHLIFEASLQLGTSLLPPTKDQAQRFRRLWPIQDFQARFYGSARHHQGHTPRKYQTQRLL
jgi:hypothetical protein